MQFTDPKRVLYNFYNLNKLQAQRNLDNKGFVKFEY